MRQELSGAVPRQFSLAESSGYIQRLWRTTALVASAVWHRISRSKIGLAILATLACATIVLTAKFVFGMHGLLRLGDVGGNVPLGPGVVGAGGAGSAGGTHHRSPPRRKRGPKGSHKTQKPDPCAGYQRGYDQEKAILDTIDEQRKSKAKAYNEALPKLGQLFDQFNQVAPQALAALKEFQRLQVVVACANLVAELGLMAIEPELGIGEMADGAGGGAGVFHFLEAVTDIGDTLNASSGSLEQMREWAVSNLSDFPNDLTLVLNMVNLGEQMQELTQQMKALKNQYDQMQGERDTQAQKVADAKAALDACRAGQPGDASAADGDGSASVGEEVGATA